MLNLTIMNPSTQIPGGKKFFKGIFDFFSCFDDIFLYIYHKRRYEIASGFFLTTTHLSEKQKWSFI